MKDTEKVPTPPAPVPPAALSLDEVRQCTRLLETIAADRFLMASLPEDERIAFLAAAGRVLHPDRSAKSRFAKKLRRNRKQTKHDNDRVVRASTRIRTMRSAAVFTAPQLPLPPPAGEPERILEIPRKCYVCKEEFRKLHFFYDSMCGTCADFNYAKRTQRAPLSGKVAVITGARVQIGFQASLMLLRSAPR